MILYVGNSLDDDATCLGAFIHLNDATGLGEIFKAILLPGWEEWVEVMDVVVTPESVALICRARPTFAEDEAKELLDHGWRLHGYATNAKNELVGISLSPVLEEIVSIGHWPVWDEESAHVVQLLGAQDSPTVVFREAYESSVSGKVFSLAEWREKKAGPLSRKGG